MSLTPNDLIASRDRSLNHLLGLSGACLEAGQRLSDLLAAVSREALQQGGRQLAQFGHGQVESLAGLPFSLWLEHHQRSQRFVDAAWAILGDSRRQWLENAEAQVRLLDQLALALLHQDDSASLPTGGLAALPPAAASESKPLPAAPAPRRAPPSRRSSTLQ